jgi:DNA-binding transcriptional LysR family regulator
MWLLAHLGAKLDFLRAGFGFGFMPLHVVDADLASGELVQIAAEEVPPQGHVISMSAIYRTDSPPGPAGRWIIDHLKQASRTAPEIIRVEPRNGAVLSCYFPPDRHSQTQMSRTHL